MQQPILPLRQRFSMAAFLLLLPAMFTSMALAAAEERAGTQQQNVNDFDIIDANVDGLISYGEFQRWHQAVLRAEPKVSAALFGTHDADRDGKLTVAEFVPLAFELSRKPDKETEQVFKKFDANADGLLTAEELKAQSVSADIVAGLLQVADADADGRISFREFGQVADTFESHISQESTNLGQAQSLLAALDADADGQISAAELSAYGGRYGAKNPVLDQAAAETALLELDEDKNGSISLDELKRLPEAVMRAVGIRPIVAA